MNYTREIRDDIDKFKGYVIPNGYNFYNADESLKTLAPYFNGGNYNRSSRLDNISRGDSVYNNYNSDVIFDTFVDRENGSLYLQPRKYADAIRLICYQDVYIDYDIRWGVDTWYSRFHINVQNATKGNVGGIYIMMARGKSLEVNTTLSDEPDNYFNIDKKIEYNANFYIMKVTLPTRKTVVFNIVNKG